MILTFGFECSHGDLMAPLHAVSRLTLAHLSQLSEMPSKSGKPCLILDAASLTPAIVDLFGPVLLYSEVALALESGRQLSVQAMRALRQLATGPRPPLVLISSGTCLLDQSARFFRRSIRSEVLYRLVMDVEIEREPLAVELLTLFACSAPDCCSHPITRTTHTLSRSPTKTRLAREMLMLARLAYAADELRRRSHSVQEISHLCGFGSSRTLQRHLRQLLMHSPSRSRRVEVSIEDSAQHLAKVFGPRVAAAIELNQPVSHRVSQAGPAVGAHPVTPRDSSESSTSSGLRTLTGSSMQSSPSHSPSHPPAPPAPHSTASC